MKSKLLLLSVSLLTTSVFAQNMEDSKKVQKIQENPEAYQKAGGEIGEEFLVTPRKERKDLIHEDFIIHYNIEEEQNESNLERDFRKLRSIQNQGSYEYMNEKELFLQKYPEMRPAQWDGTVEPKPTNVNHKK